MKKLFAVFLVAGLAACGNAGEVKAEIDSTITQVKNSEAFDSIEIKGERISDTVGRKGGELWDSTKSKGEKLLNKADRKLEALKKKDSAN